MRDDEPLPRVVTPPKYRVGDRVRIRYGRRTAGRIVELRGPLGPGGVQVYGVRYRAWPEPVYTEATEDELILLPPKVTPAPPAPAPTPPPA